MDYLLAFLVTVFGWWFSTGLILFLNHLPVSSHRWSMACLSIICLISLKGVSATSADPSVAAAVLAYGHALVIWGWLEMGYLMGFVTGPSNRLCPPETTGWTRFSLALQTSLYHELLVVLVVFAVIALTAGGPNQVTALCCVVLWLMRWSAKLNLFLGVRNFHAEWLPANQRYLASYINRRRINGLLPVSVLVGMLFSGYFFSQGVTGATGSATVGNLIVSLLLALAVLEHLLLVLPVDDSRLWQWAVSLHARKDRGSCFHPRAAAPEAGVAGQGGS